MNRIRIYNDINAERLRQQGLFPGASVSDDIGDLTRLMVLTEEAGEVAKAVRSTLYPRREPPNLREELIQVAAISVGWVEWIDAGEGPIVSGENSSMLNALREEGTKEECLVQLDRVLGERNDATRRNIALEQENARLKVALRNAVTTIPWVAKLLSPEDRAALAPASAGPEKQPPHLRGDGPCQDCGGPNIIWFAPNVFWNAVMSPPGEVHHGDPGGIVCVHCFVKRAEAKFAPTGWQLTAEWPWAAAHAWLAWDALGPAPQQCGGGA